MLRSAGAALADLAHRPGGRRLAAVETQLAGLIAASMDGIVTLDEARRVTLCNPAAERMFARPAAEIVGQSIDRLLAAACREEFPPPLGAAPPHPLIVHGVRGDGGEFAMEASLVRHAVGDRLFVTAVLRDISPRLHAEARLQQLSSALEQSPVAIQITDAHLRICYVNRRFCELTGYALEEVLGRESGIARAADMAAHEYLRLRAALAGGREWHGEFRNRRKDGSAYCGAARIVPLTDAAGRVTHFLAIKEDVSEKKALEKRERQRQEQLVHGARLMLLGEMASTLAHEVNQPLMAINAYSAACRRAARDCPDALELLNKIDAQVTRAGKIVWRTRDFARRRSYREAIDLPTLVHGVIDWLAAEARRLDITVEASGVAQPLPRICADRLQIEQVLLNLLRNAFEAVRAVDGARRVVLTAGPASGGELLVSVHDSGPGVPAEVAPDIFQPFFTTRPSGLGLGLAISRSIIEDHGGRLWYAATPAGAAFHFSLPDESAAVFVAG